MRQDITPRLRVGAIAGAGAATLLLGAGAATAQVEPDAGMLRYPDVSSTHIVFSYANDLWLVPREGGEARPLASPPGAEASPRFSPDGRTIAFVGNYEGDRDIYTISADGGRTFRVTHHPDNEGLNDWTPDGRLIFTARAYADAPAGGRAAQLFSVSPDGGLPERLPVPYGDNASVSEDGWLAYNPTNRDWRTWKRYRGGMANEIWLFHLEDHESIRMTDWEGTDTQPMWHDGIVYYLSDAGPEHRLNVWSYNPQNERHTQLTRFEEYDVKSASIGPGPRGGGEIIFQNGPTLYLFDISMRRSTPVSVSIPGDRPKLRPQRLDASEDLQAANISSTGKRAVVQARGDIWTAPAEEGSPRNLTNSDGEADRDPSWSPDGRWVAYFSDARGEYNLHITQSDGKGETRRLTDLEGLFLSNPIWSPNSESIVFTDQSGTLHMVDIESETLTTIDSDPWANAGRRPSFSHDGRWIAFHRSDEENGGVSAIWVYNTETGEKTRLTSGMFQDSDPVFDRKGDYLYFATQRAFSPTYEDYGTTFIYDDTEVLVAVPLRADMESPYAPTSDEEEWDEEGDDEEADEVDAEADEDAEEADEEAEPAPDDGVSGVWEGTMTGGEPLPPGGAPVTITLRISAEGGVSGSIVMPMATGAITGGRFDEASGALTFSADFEGVAASFACTIAGGSLEGAATAAEMGVTADITATRTSTLAEAGGDDDEDAGDDEAREVVEIDVENFEMRAMQLAPQRGSFWNLRVNNRNQLLYVRSGSGGDPAGIRLFDIDDEKKEEKTVAAGAVGFRISGDGKKILAFMGGVAGSQIMDASANATGKPIVTRGMHVVVDPRDEWRNLVVDAWRRQRDFFYDPGMHGVDWDAMLDRYLEMLDDCNSREDVTYVIAEMISELNVGHAYYRAGGTEEQPSVSVGMLGCDFELVRSDAGDAYRITEIYHGAPWDLNARGPLSQPGVDVSEGDYLLAVNGAPIDTRLDPWAAFIGTAGMPTTLTLSEKPFIDDEAREILVEPITSESGLRYRAWIEAKREYVDYKTDGRVGYIYVPNTGVGGQNDLVRQFVGQLQKDALIIDERWNGGGQIPTRFIELLNRPRVNYWARRFGNDWPWPPDSHQGPKTMLINGLAGSGGDAFPYYFRQAGLGKLIGTRTWGGLVGITGMPPLIDGTGVTVPNFAFYELDGTWGVEGHGVDPDIEVIDDPALMVDGGDPQLDKAIEVMLQELAQKPYVKPDRPDYPDRSGMGLPQAER